MRFLFAIMLFLLLAAIQGCKKTDEDYTLSPAVECGDTLITDPVYGDNLIQFKMNSWKNTIPFNVSHQSTSGGSSLVSFFTIAMRWQEEVDSFRYSVQLDVRKTLNVGDTLHVYDLFKPGSYPYINYHLPEEDWPEVAVLFYVVSDYNTGNFQNFTEVYTSNMLNEDATFEITNRSPVFIENGHFFSVVQGIFCCNLITQDALGRSAVLQGNFNGKIFLQ